MVFDEREKLLIINSEILCVTTIVKAVRMQCMHNLNCCYLYDLLSFANVCLHSILILIRNTRCSSVCTIIPSTIKMNDLYRKFQNNPVLNEAELASLSIEKSECRPQVLAKVRSSVCEKMILTRVTKITIMKPLTIPAHEEQSHVRMHHIDKTKEIIIWSLSSTDKVRSTIKRNG